MELWGEAKLFGVFELNVVIRIFLLFLNAGCTALFSECYVHAQKVRKWYVDIFICFSAFVFNIAVSLGICYWLYGFSPEKESFWLLVRRLLYTHATDFVLPFLLSLVAGMFVGVLLGRSRNKALKEEQAKKEHLVDSRLPTRLENGYVTDRQGVARKVLVEVPVTEEKKPKAIYRLSGISVALFLCSFVVTLSFLLFVVTRIFLFLISLVGGLGLGVLFWLNRDKTPEKERGKVPPPEEKKPKVKFRFFRAATALFLCLSMVASSFLFFVDTFQRIQRPQYTPPTETIASLVNSRLRTYLSCMTASDFEGIGDGESLRAENQVATPPVSDVPASEPQEPPVYPEPTNFRGYLVAIIDGTYAPNMGFYDYVDKAYALFEAGKHQNDYFSIALMWYFKADALLNFQGEDETEKKQYLQNSIDAYHRFEQIYGGEYALYSNMANVYNDLGDFENSRDCFRRALRYEVSESALSRYKKLLFSQVLHAEDVYTVLMEDASFLLTQKKDLSLYIFYGVLAIGFNENVDSAYELLLDADTYYEGNSAFVKILLTICQSLLGKTSEEQATLQQVYALEQASGGLSTWEEWYLVKYLFANGRDTELWGYLSDINQKNSDYRFDSENLVLSAAYFLNRPLNSKDDMQAQRDLLERLHSNLKDEWACGDNTEIVALSTLMLENHLGELDDEKYKEIAKNITDTNSDIGLVFLATNAFNSEKYDEAIDLCDKFMNLLTSRHSNDAQNEAESPERSMALQLGPQDQTIIQYYMQLIKAHSHFEYAKTFRKGSEQWEVNMQIAELECNAFTASTKSLAFIQEKFEVLKNSIDIANGKMPESSSETVKVET